MELGVAPGVGGAALAPAPIQRIVGFRHRDRDYGLRRALLGADGAALILSLVVALAVSGAPSPILDALPILLTLPFWLMLFRAYGLYVRPLRRFEPTYLDDVSSLFHALLIGTLGLWAFFRLLPDRHLALEEVVLFNVFAGILVTALRSIVRVANLRLRGPERVLVIAPEAEVGVLERKFRNHPEYEMKIVSSLSPDGEWASFGIGCVDLDDVFGQLLGGRIDHVMVQFGTGLLSQEEIAELMYGCFRARVRFSTFPSEGRMLPPGVEVNHVEGTGFLSHHPPVLSRSSAAIKRAMDVAIAIPLLLLLAVPFAAIVLAIKLDDGGRAIFSQTRVGRDGRRFRLLKFRTMVAGADSDERVAKLMERSLDPDWLVVSDDPRVTRVGRFLRSTSLDELPQLWNVIRGEMSLVGPRPLPERDDAIVRGWGRHRLDFTPGVTGYWQVLGRNSIPFREMVEIDYAYVTSWSLWQDIKLLIRTVPAVLRRSGWN